MNVRGSIESNSQPSKVVKPTECSFGHPAIDAKATSMFFISTSQMRFNAAMAKLIPVRFRIIGAISIQLRRSINRVAWLAGDWWNSIDQGNQLRHVVAIGSGQCVAQRNTVCVRQDVVFAARFAAIC